MMRSFCHPFNGLMLFLSLLFFERMRNENVRSESNRCEWIKRRWSEKCRRRNDKIHMQRWMLSDCLSTIATNIQCAHQTDLSTRKSEKRIERFIGIVNKREIGFNKTRKRKRYRTKKLKKMNEKSEGKKTRNSNWYDAKQIMFVLCNERKYQCQSIEWLKELTSIEFNFNFEALYWAFATSRWISHWTEKWPRFLWNILIHVRLNLWFISFISWKIRQQVSLTIRNWLIESQLFVSKLKGLPMRPNLNILLNSMKQKSNNPLQHGKRWEFHYFCRKVFKFAYRKTSFLVSWQLNTARAEI